MGLYNQRSKEYRIVDRVLPEICELNRNADPGQLLRMVSLLSSMGVDLLEINREVVRALKWLPQNTGFLFRAADAGDVELALRLGIRDIIIGRRQLLDDKLYTMLSHRDLNVTVEFMAENIEEIGEQYDSVHPERLGIARYIRFTGLSRLMGPAWTEELGALAGRSGAGLEICPLDTFHMGVSIAVEGLMNGADGVAAAFMGYGNGCEYAALEEILIGAKVLINKDNGMDLTILPEIADIFSVLTGRPIPVNKPVLGNNIFQYESGIHADGIEKNPVTYEPFDPSTVGMRRQLAIGKHSGTRSISKKLDDLMIYYDAARLGDILKAVREKSMELRRSLKDSELKDIVREVCFYGC